MTGTGTPACPGLCYARIAYLYARPGAIDDHRRIQLSELVVAEIRAMEPIPAGGASNSTFRHFEEIPKRIEGRAPVLESGVQPGASRNRLVTWYARAGDRLRVTFPVDAEGDYALNLVAAHWPESGALRLECDGSALVTENLGGAASGRAGEERVALETDHARRLLSIRFKVLHLAAGEHELSIECVEPGRFGLDYLWVKRR